VQGVTAGGHAARWGRRAPEVGKDHDGPAHQRVRERREAGQAGR
jgi:hypothetical protein